MEIIPAKEVQSYIDAYLKASIRYKRGQEAFKVLLSSGVPEKVVAPFLQEVS